eukprot:TRINITY_DN7543_c0_g1_i1.p1 TRINITY_DN7543_c0_g1~~TRINITY_DN7543_c0_g1_i1.p1  ORF type:complete len:184 (+),score=53.65 TRINITY_DN7543_c0_g1_i1:60-554(+)
MCIRDRDELSSLIKFINARKGEVGKKGGGGKPIIRTVPCDGTIPGLATITKKAREVAVGQKQATSNITNITKFDLIYNISKDKATPLSKYSLILNIGLPAEIIYEDKAEDVLSSVNLGNNQGLVPLESSPSITISYHQTIEVPKLVNPLGNQTPQVYNVLVLFY